MALDWVLDGYLFFNKFSSWSNEDCLTFYFVLLIILLCYLVNLRLMLIIKMVDFIKLLLIGSREGLYLKNCKN
jgi:hypothetical protein